MVEVCLPLRSPANTVSANSYVVSPITPSFAAPAVRGCWKNGRPGGERVHRPAANSDRG
jgi:hypothetical protein